MDDWTLVSGLFIFNACSSLKGVYAIPYSAYIFKGVNYTIPEWHGMSMSESNLHFLSFLFLDGTNYTLNEQKTT